MKNFRSVFYPVIVLFALVALNACKAKKIVQKPAPPVAEAQPAPVEQPKPQPVAQTPPPPPPVAKPNYNFSNIQFEFNSGVLKTESYPILDNAVIEMKKDTTVRFTLSGYASAEGTPEHNQALSVERANSVKLYLVNSGVKDVNLIPKGFGESNPVSTNDDEAGRSLNRRVEIKKQ